MKKSVKQIGILILIYSLFIVHCLAQAPPWLWAKSAGDSAFNQIAQSVCSDKIGNIIVTGWFAGKTISFDKYTLYNSDISGWTANIFLVKFDSTGNVIWAKNAGFNGNIYPYSVATDLSGNIYVAGFFDSNNITFDTINFKNLGTNDKIFITQYDKNGNALWAYTAGVSYDNWATSVTVDAFGNPILAGSFGDYFVKFGSFTLYNPDPTGGGAIPFLVKFDTNGKTLWAKNAGGNCQGVISSASTDSLGNIYAAGSFGSDTIIFGSYILINANSQLTHTEDIFIVKYDSKGNVQWAQRAGGIGDDEATSITVNDSGYVYMTGYGGDITFGSFYLQHGGMYIVKYDGNGNVHWAKNAGGWTRGYGVTTDVHDNVYVTGNYSDAIFGSDTLKNNGVYVTKYDATGKVIWAKSGGGSSDIDSYSAYADNVGNVYIVGDFSSSTIKFDNVTLTNSDDGDSLVGYDMFIAKLASKILGIEKLNNITHIYMYPNPATNILNIQLNSSNLQFSNSTILQIYNLQGEEVYNKKIYYSHEQINVSNFNEGMYILKITTDKTILTKKFIKANY